MSAAAVLNSLDPEFRAKVEQLVSNCAAQGVEMRPYFGLRSPIIQAKLWRQSRATEEIEEEVKRLRAAGATFLAVCIELAGPQQGKPVTNAPPGLSWHQWGEAVDCVWIEQGNAVWAGVGYDVYDAEAKKLGLTTITWERDHVQLRPQGAPSDVFPLAEIDRVMKERFGASAPVS